MIRNAAVLMLDSATLTTTSVSALSGSLNAPNPDFNFTGDWWARQIAGPSKRSRLGGALCLILANEDVDDQVYPRIDTSTINKSVIIRCYNAHHLIPQQLMRTQSRDPTPDAERELRHDLRYRQLRPWSLSC